MLCYLRAKPHKSHLGRGLKMAHLTLRAMSVGDLLDESIGLYRLNFIPFVGAVAAIRVPVLLMGIIASMVKR